MVCLHSNRTLNKTSFLLYPFETVSQAWSSCLQPNSTRVTSLLDYTTLYRLMLGFDPVLHVFIISTLIHRTISIVLDCFKIQKVCILSCGGFEFHNDSPLGPQEFSPLICLIRNWICDCVSEERSTVLQCSVGNRNMMKFYFLVICS